MKKKLNKTPPASPEGTSSNSPAFQQWQAMDGIYIDRPPSACVLECGGKRSATPLSTAQCHVNWVSFVLVLVICSAAFVASAKPSAPIGLLVNGANNPLAIERDATRFTWMSKDTERGERQAAYQIVVFQLSNASTLQRFNASTVIWDSGKVDSDQSASVEYGGRALPAATRFWWKVRVWDQTGNASPYGAPAYFDTGLKQDEWTAHYIWDETTNQNNYAYFRKTFSLISKPSLAKVYVTAHNDYLLYCNGQPLGRGPARCDPYHYGQYNAYDVTSLLKPGTNVFAAMAHWVGVWRDSGCNAKPAFLLQARLDSPGGSSSTIQSDGSWKVLAHTPFIETNPTYFSGGGPMLNRAAIRFDSRQEPDGWQGPDFDDSGWASAFEVDRSDFHLFAQMAPLEHEHAELKPISATFTNGAWLVDFGRCIDGWPKITMRANHAGDTVRIEYFQMANGRKPSGWDEYTCKGGQETWDADFGRHATFQVLRITGYAGKLRPSDIRGMWAYSDADVEGRFHCSSPMLNDIYEMCERSARQNIQQGMVSVDANREQSQWTADSWLIASVLIYNHRNTMMVDKIVRDYAGEQKSDGDFYACSPSPMFEIPEWSMYWPMLLWEQYTFSGDKTLLREMSPHLTRFLAWMNAYQDPKTKLPNPPNWRITDWAPQLTPHGGINTATCCQYFENLRIASRIFHVLGQTEQSDDYWQQAEQVKAAINARLFNGEYYLARTDTNRFFPLASAWALRFNIEPSEEDKSIIVAAIERGGKPAIGGYGGDALYSGLFNAGGGAFAVSDLARYRPMLEDNKANWESWTPRDEVNHAWTAYPGYIFLKYICGIQPTSGGFATFDVRPSTGGLTFAEGTVPTVKGLISTRWEIDGGNNFSLAIKVPANSCASIYIPKLSQNVTITESGKRIWPAAEINDPGVLAVSDENDSIKCTVGAGIYQFREAP